ncbi:MAG: bifunctional folylpolyglutamate synthase/dihydrofolate synthase [Elusimicrobia bacterium HGW-Elusimicrobia-4]|nr:MAG: bifunctional folylpolyglutamate synthase/dihydrofolate synthase [Elusimicrobia bacterium HGW-Elusimicrobia-4]
MKYNEAIEFVNNLEEFRYKFGLERIKSFLNLLGNPQDKIKIIHIAGTNGKGSTCAYISTILQKAGCKVGLYTSPHLLDIKERIQINRKKIPKKDFTSFVSTYTLHPTPYTLTYFELLTAMAFWYFEKEKVDYAVIEVGLGGRLDATNVIKNPLVSVITNISLEHTQYLGNTVSKIASEKAGIIKNNGTVITGTSGIALRTIEKIAKIKNARIIISKKQKNFETSLLGIHQKQNANLAMGVCRLLDIPEKYISNGLQNTVWPGRFEVRQLQIADCRLQIVMDCAHNPSGMMVLNTSIKRYFKKKINFVFGVLKDKDYKKMIKTISSVAKNVFISSPQNKRALNPKIVKKEFLKYISQKNIFVFDGIKNAVKSAIKKSEDFCITGSVYTIAEAMKCLKIG